LRFWVLGGRTNLTETEKERERERERQRRKIIQRIEAGRE